MNSGKLVVAGKPCGTAWLVSENLALTAEHCLPTGVVEAELEFASRTWTMRVLERDVELDAAILKIVSPSAGLPEPLVLSSRPDEHVQSEWRAHGFPTAILESQPYGLVLSGTVEVFPPLGAVSIPAKTWMQLTCNQAMPGGNPNKASYSGKPVPVFRGASGAPVQVNSCHERVVGIIRRTEEPVNDRIIFATPVDLIYDRFRAHLGKVHLHPWSEDIVLAASPKASGGLLVRCSVDLAQLPTLWDASSKRLQITCEFDPFEYEALATGVLRLALHSPGSVEMHVPRPDAWQKFAESLVQRWIPLHDVRTNDRVERIAWKPILEAARSAHRFTAGGGHDPDEAARFIHRSCDRWVLSRLHEQIRQVLEAPDTVPMLDYRLADDFREPARAMWDAWRAQLSSDPAHLRHFLTLILTHDSAYKTDRAVVGAGLLTLDKCLLRSVLFTLAANACMSPSYAPISWSPGNLGLPDSQAGHACGIEIMDSRRLNYVVKDHGWRTPVVFLHHLSSPPLFLSATQTRQNRVPGMVSLSLRDPFPTTLLLGADRGFVQAVEQGMDVLRDHLAQRHAEFAQAQENYYKASSAFQA